jgi:hypothetical protein
VWRTFSAPTGNRTTTSQSHSNDYEKVCPFLDVMPCCLVETYFCGETCCPSYTLKIEATSSSEISIKIHQTTWHHIILLWIYLGNRRSAQSPPPPIASLSTYDGLHDDPVSSYTKYRRSNDKIIHERSIGKDSETGGRSNCLKGQNKTMKPSGYLVSWPKFEPGTSRMRI